MVKPVSTYYNSPKLITTGGFHIGTTATECATVLDFGPIKKMYGNLQMLMEVTASTAFRASKTSLVFHISAANWSPAWTHHVFPVSGGPRAGHSTRGGIPQEQSRGGKSPPSTMIVGYESFNAAQGASAFLGCKHALPLPFPMCSSQLTLLALASGLLKHCSVISSSCSALH